MNCKEFESELEGLDHCSAPSPQMESHRRLCPACSELLEDITYISLQARQILIVEQPPDRVWIQIRERLNESGMVGSAFRRPASRLALGWFPRFSMGMAYASVFLVALGVVRVYSILSVPVANPPLPSAPNPPFAQLFEKDNQPFAQLIEKVPAKERAVYVENLNQVNSSIQELNTFLASHPEDPFARQELVSTYHQKSRLWEALVRWQEF